MGPPAAGGHCVSHHQDATVFVRGSLPDELVRARVNGAGRGGRILFATVVEVVEGSPLRVTPPCAYADVCGGCDLQHVEPGWQRVWKKQVLADQLRTIGRIEEVAGRPMAEALDVVEVGVPRDRAAWEAAAAEDVQTGLGWRTKVSVAVSDGRAGFHRHRSEEIVPVTNCPVCVPELAAIFRGDWSGIDRVDASVGDPGGYRIHSTSKSSATAADGDTAGAVNSGAVNQGAAIGKVGDLRARAWVRREAAGRHWRVATDGFWQAHRGAPDVLVAAVERALAPTEEDHLWDLYSGVGLFAGALAHRVARVDAVEGDATAAKLARRNLHDLTQVRIHQQPVSKWLAEDPGCPSIVVLDPPRVGAGAEVIARISDSTATRLAYVACDGAALARDLRSLLAAGWRLETLEAFDLFPMTQHLEAVAGLTRTVKSTP